MFRFAGKKENFWKAAACWRSPADKVSQLAVPQPGSLTTCMEKRQPIHYPPGKRCANQLLRFTHCVQALAWVEITVDADIILADPSAAPPLIQACIAGAGCSNAQLARAPPGHEDNDASAINSFTATTSLRLDR